MNEELLLQKESEFKKKFLAGRQYVFTLVSHRNSVWEWIKNEIIEAERRGRYHIFDVKEDDEMIAVGSRDGKSGYYVPMLLVKMMIEDGLAEKDGEHYYL